LGFLTSIRSSLVLISFTAVALILWLSVSFWYTAYEQRLDAAQLLQSIETEDLLFESSRTLSRQRSLVHLILSRVEKAQDTDLAELSALQVESRVRFNIIRKKLDFAITDTALNDRFTFVNSEISKIYNDVIGLVNKLSSKDDWIIEQASLPLSQRDTGVKEHTFNQFSSLIDSTQLLRWGTHFVPRHSVLDINHLQALRVANWLFSDAIAREASLMSSFLATKVSLIRNERMEIEAIHSETLATWRALQQYTTKRGAIPALITAIADIETQYFNEFIKFRDVIINHDNLVGQNSMTLGHWLSVEDKTTDLVDQLDLLNSEQIRAVAVVVETKALRNLLIDSAIVLICLLIGVAVIGVLRKIRHLATHDDLTGLPNRICFEGILDTEIEHSQKKPVAVLFVDLDGFKHVNDTLGHDIGDKLLGRVSLRMAQSVANRGLVARHGGDEFSVIVAGYTNKDDVLDIANQLVKAVAPEFKIDGFSVRIGASIGLSFYPDDASSADELKRNADFAMYYAKSQGRNCVRSYDQDIASEYQQRLQLKDDLKYAIDDHQFELYYQPQVSINAQEVVGLEALIRWHHPIKGFISPENFISIAEESGQIQQIGDWVLDEACRQMALWHNNGLAKMQIAVNVSAMQFMRPGFVDYVKKICKRHSLNPSTLELEITESVLVSDVQQVIDTCHRLQELNIKVAIDDFGTGYSSLSYLQDLPVDTLKIDRAFVSGLDDITSKSVAKTIVTLAQACGLQTVAEGVETADQANMIAELGCDYIQGYFYSKPVPASELIQRVATINDYCRNNSRAA
jgi:diguanylate cyclase (GGDEF)-like protein